MKYFYKLNESEPFTDKEYSDLRGHLITGGVPETMFTKVEFLWNRQMGKEVNGCFSIWHRDKIFLTMSFRGDLMRLAAVAAHELKHRSDFILKPMVYIICCVPIVRLITIEPRALRLQEQVNMKLEIDEGWWL